MSKVTMPTKRRPSAPDSARRRATPPAERGPGGRKPRYVTVDLGKEAMQTLHTFALIRQMTVEDLAARWLSERIEEEWGRWDERIQADAEEELA